MTKTEIANIALAKFREGRITDIESTTDSVAVVMNDQYDHALALVLEEHRWNFAGKRVTLTKLSEDPPFGWSYQYQLPSDIIRLKDVNGEDVEASSKLFAIEGTALLTNDDEVTITYVAKVTDTNLFSPSFTEALTFKLASITCGRLTGDADLAIMLDKQYNYALSKAIHNDTKACGSRDTNLMQRMMDSAPILGGAYRYPSSGRSSGRSSSSSGSVPAHKHGLTDLLQSSATDGQLISWSDSASAWQATDRVPDYAQQIVVTQDNVAETLGGTIDSTKVYFIDGVIDLGSTQIVVPPTGMTFRGHSFDISGLTSSEDNYSMFVSESIAIGSGNLLGGDVFLSVTGTNSKVYDLYDATGFNAFEFTRINYINCTSLGDIYDYRQGLEEGTGRFGGSPSLTLHGLWRGGYRITTSIVRSLDAGMTEPLFKEGTAFQMNSRFLTDINCDLPASAAFCDFSNVVFPNPSTVQVKGAIFSRDGTFDATDTNIFPNLDSGDLECDWDNNIGINNTFVGGFLNNDTEVSTSIAVAGTAVDLDGTFVATDLQHFSSPANGRLRHDGINPKEFMVNFDFVIEGGNNDEVEIFLIKIDADANVSVEYSQLRVINNLQGGRDVAYFTGQVPVRLNQNDFVFWQVANVTDTTNVVLEVDSSWAVRER